MDLLRLQRQGAVARIVIDQPRRRNALRREMWRALPGLVQQVASDAALRVLVLQGAQPGLFAAGADISEFEQTYADPAEGARAAREIEVAVDALEACSLPVIALIDGPCIGGGIALALACDVRLASTHARFAVTPAKLGLSYHPDDLRRLVRACGLPAASELLFGGQLWSAERALQVGLVNQVLPATEFAAAAESLLQAIAANSSTALRALKRGLRAVAERDAHATADATREFLALFSSADFIEGRDAFLEKRTAAFPSHKT
jgi:enoyl-CoA hydratase/carnithine racemase